MVLTTPIHVPSEDEVCLRDTNKQYFSRVVEALKETTGINQREANIEEKLIECVQIGVMLVLDDKVQQHYHH